MNKSNFVKEYLTLTRKDRVGLLVLCILIIAVVIAPRIVAKQANATKPLSSIDSSWIAAVNNLQIAESNSANTFLSEDQNPAYDFQSRNNRQSAQARAELFEFDPNTISNADWKRLGLRDKTIATIQNYLSKGGHFYKPEDLSRIYGLFNDEYERLAPYIHIERKIPTGTFSNNQSEEIPTSTKVAVKKYQSVDINLADTSSLIALPGIGSKLATRIVNFRDKLGGFYSINQVGETFGLPDSTYQKIKPYLDLNDPSVKKININTATVDELKMHPYIRYALANPIIAYRNQHGKFVRLEDIKKVMPVTEEVFKKIAPYISL